MSEENKEKHISVSECCGADYSPIPPVIKKQPWGQSYYRYRCAKCEKPCHLKLDRAFDSAGIEINPGDILECPEVDMDHGEHYHAVYTDERGELTIRDLGNNNVEMYRLNGPYYNIGSYWKHLDKLTDEDLQYYWGTTRAEAENKLKEVEHD